jgi:hypothetical protein
VHQGIWYIEASVAPVPSFSFSHELGTQANAAGTGGDRSFCPLSFVSLFFFLTLGTQVAHATGTGGGRSIDIYKYVYIIIYT